LPSTIDEIRSERHVLERVLFTGQADPTGDDARLDLVQPVADDRPVRRLRHFREVHHAETIGDMKGLFAQVHASPVMRRPLKRLGRNRHEVGMDKPHHVRSSEPFCLLARHDVVRRRCIHGNGSHDALLEWTTRQRADSGSDIQQRPVQGSCVREAFLNQAGRGAWTSRAVALQFLGGLLLVELVIRCAFERRATG
jgi:hypothetical protein